ncbi:hypothetical protein [Lentilactobacillus sp. SPB1-3]|uniref:Uncharacterized protein n=1 Tax=Lentilactobacillus terminaliae TaxID=3003483 RepID=A0ACD5DCV5_9LACO|nr:hypothetical protein [Lentilactobacillus sp. SPB1-3]MCZ0978044.1 hypothetical protein [Lentilactobacillus sp. SPB1-3]
MNEEEQNLTNDETLTNTDTEAVTETSSKNKDFSLLPLNERVQVKDLDDKNRQLTITQKDGSVLEVNITQPNLRTAESIDDCRTEIRPISGDTGVLRTTTARFHEALFSLFSAVLIDNKPKGNLDWDLADTLERETYDWLMDQADTFLASKS